jgi:hypothetical protein
MRKYTHDSGEVWYMTICKRIQHLAPRRNTHKIKKNKVKHKENIRKHMLVNMHD